MTDKELEKRVFDRITQLTASFKIDDNVYDLSIQTLIWETEARIEEHNKYCGEYLFGGCDHINQLQSELKMLRGE